MKDIIYEDIFYELDNASIINESNIDTLIQRIILFINKIIERAKYNKDIIFKNNEKIRNIVKTYKNSYYNNFKDKNINFKAYKYTDLSYSNISDLFSTIDKNINNLHSDINYNIKSINNIDVNKVINSSVNILNAITDFDGTSDEYKSWIINNLRSKNQINYNKSNFNESNIDNIINYFLLSNDYKDIRSAYDILYKKCNFLKMSLDFKYLNKSINNKLFNKDSDITTLLRHYISVIKEEINILWITYKTIIDIEREKRDVYIRILNALSPEGFKIQSVKEENIVYNTNEFKNINLL